MQKIKIAFKYSYLLTALLLAIVVTACKKAPQTTEEKLTGKWTMMTAIGNYTIQGTSHKDTTTFTANDYFDFKADGSVTIVESNKTYNGNWNITNNKLYFSNTNYIDYTSGFDISVLTRTDLQLFYTEYNYPSILEQKLNLSK